MNSTELLFKQVFKYLILKTLQQEPYLGFEVIIHSTINTLPTPILIGL